MANTRHVEHLAERMRKHGWDDKDISHLKQCMTTEHTNDFFISRFQEILHWLVFLIIVTVNFFASAVIVPLLFFLPNPGIYAVLMVVGLCFGLLYAIVLQDIAHLFDNHHHVTSAVLIPALACINVFLLVSFIDARFSNVYFEVRYPWVMGLFYAVAFILPYVIVLVVRRLHRT